MINSTIIQTAYILMDNCEEDELDFKVAAEQLGSLLNTMQYEKAFGNLDDVITKEEVTFSDTTGIVTNTFTNFGHPTYIEFEGVGLEECPVSMLDFYYESGMQRVAFWSDTTTETKYIQLAIPQTGTLKVWYEEDVAHGSTLDATVKFRTSLKYCLATRLAQNCLPYVKYKDQQKAINKPVIMAALQMQADHWTNIYEELVSRIGTNRPFTRLPFQAKVQD